MIESDYTAGFEAARKNMVEHQIRCCKILDTDLLDMLSTLPREQFLPEDIQSLAYMEGHVPLPCGQEMLSPLQEATIMQQLQLQGNESVLLIGAGTGFLAMLLALRSTHVTACELHQSLAEMAQANLSSHGISNADIHCVNAMDKAAMDHTLAEKTFDVIVIAAAIQEIPDHIHARLHDQSQLVSFVGSNPVVTLQHDKIQGPAYINTPLMDTLLLNIEGLPEVRKLDF